ncbi:MAG: hypothetical protein ACFFD4_20580 [Candidatus Odinarchaeota archaeon]
MTRGRPFKYKKGAANAKRIEFRLKDEDEYVKTILETIRDNIDPRASLGEFITNTILKPYITRNYLLNAGEKTVDGIFDQLLRMIWDRSSYNPEKTENRPDVHNPVITYDLPPALCMKLLYDADKEFFSSIPGFDTQVLFKTWAEFLFENRIIRSDCSLATDAEDFHQNLGELGELCHNFLAGYYHQLKTNEWITSLLEKIDMKTSEQTKSTVNNPRAGLQELVTDPCEYISVLNPWRETTFPVIKIQQLEEFSQLIGPNEIKLLLKSYEAATITSTFHGLFSLWSRFAREMMHFHALINGCKELKTYLPEFYRGCKQLMRGKVFNNLVKMQAVIGRANLSSEKAVDLFKNTFRVIGEKNSVEEVDYSEMLSSYCDPELVKAVFILFSPDIKLS